MLNKVILIGNLGNDPEIRYTGSGEAAANLSLATTEKWKDKSTGEQKEATEWHRLSMFGKLAELAGQYLKKGSRIYVEGSIHTRKWKDQNNQDKYSTEIKVREMKFLSSPSGGQGAGQGNQGGYDQAPQQRQQQQQQRQAPAPQQSNQGGFGEFDDDIPF